MGEPPGEPEPCSPQGGRPEADWGRFLDDHARAAAGDARAAERVVRVLYGRVRAHVRRRLRRYPADVVADAVQEAMARVVRYLPGSRAASGRQLVRWALLVGWHAALRFVRSPAAGLAIGRDAVALDHPLLDAVLVDPADPGSTGLEPVAVVDLPRPGATRHPGGPGPAPGGRRGRGPAEADEDTTGSAVPGPVAVGRDPARYAGPVLDGSTLEGLTLDGPVVDLLRALLAEAAVGEDRDLLLLVWERAACDRLYEDLAAARGISPGAAKRRYQRTVARLRRAITTRAETLPEPLRSVALRHVGGGGGGGGTVED